MDMRDRIEKDLGGLERAARHLPGYRGYAEKETAREADKLLRDRIVAAMGVEQDRLLDMQARMVTPAGIRLVADVDAAVRRLQTLANTIRMGSYGYAGLFDAIKVGTEELDALYDHDVALLESLPTLSGAVDGLEAAVDDPEAVKPAIAAVLAAVNDLRRHWDSRREAMIALGGDEGTIAPLQ